MKRNSRGYTVNVADNRIITDEDRVHQQVVKWLQLVHKDVMFHSDAAGELMTESMRIRQSKVNMPGISFPDLQILEARGGYFGMLVEIKREDETIFNGAGMFKNDHLKRQGLTLMMLKDRNYKAIFSKGLDNIIREIGLYLAMPPTKFKKHKL
jgi:hypothetical protein